MMNNKQSDIVVMGSGLGGLAAAALLARTGRKVVVAEQAHVAGGYAQSFQRGGRIFDSAIHLVGGCDAQARGLVGVLLELLGVADQCQFQRVEPLYTAIFPDLRIEAPQGVERFIAAHVRLFPGEAEGLARLLHLSERLHEMVPRLTEGGLRDTAALAETMPELVKYRHASVQQVVDEYLHDARLKAACCALWPYVGLPPSRLSFLWWSNVLMSYVKEGASYCVGGFQKIAVALVKAIKESGGEVVLHNGVKRILVDKGMVSGVVLEQGGEMRAPVVVSNGDVCHTLDLVVPDDSVPRWYRDEVAAMEPSTSAFLLYLATTLDVRALGAQLEMLVFTSWDHEQTDARNRRGEPVAIAITIPTLADPSAAPPGEHLVVITAMVPFGGDPAWERDRKGFEEKLLDLTETVLPGLRAALTFRESATPATLARYTMNQGGACYGWAATPHQFGTERLPHITPVRGLYLAGHWTQPAGGVYGALLSGVQAAGLLCGHESAVDFLRSLVR